MLSRASNPAVKLNLAVTRSNLNNDTELILAIAYIFIEDLPKMVLALRTAFDSKDSHSVIHQAHTIKGLASNFQAEPLTQLAQKLEVEYARLTDPERDLLISELSLISKQTLCAIKDEFGLDLLRGSALRGDN